MRSKKKMRNEINPRKGISPQNWNNKKQNTEHKENK
jgi:hypothetical protein